jgi:hypothetical protein
MSKPKHTPGPWTALKTVVAMKQNLKVGVLTGKIDFPAEELEANARLIAAAPELLEALEYVSMNLGLGQGQIDPKIVELQKTMKAAIAKAKGE